MIHQKQQISVGSRLVASTLSGLIATAMLAFAYLLLVDGRTVFTSLHLYSFQSVIVVAVAIGVFAVLKSLSAETMWTRFFLVLIASSFVSFVVFVLRILFQSTITQPALPGARVPHPAGDTGVLLVYFVFLGILAAVLVSSLFGLVFVFFVKRRRRAG